MIRDFLLGSVQLHILHHAAQEPVYGLALLQELQRHEPTLSPGTLYPLLHRMEASGYLVHTDQVVRGKVRKYYTITDEGCRALTEARPKLAELVHEVMEGHGPTSIEKPMDSAVARPVVGEIERRRAEEERTELLARERAARVAAEETSAINPRRYTAEDMQAARTLADQAAFAIVHAREVTERQQAEDALRKSEERSRRLLENATDLVSVLAADGTILYESPAADRVLGANSSQERLGKNAFAFFHPDDAERVASVLADFAQRPDAIERSTFRFRHADGSWRVLEAIGHNLLHDPVIHGIIINSRDITERVQMEEGLRFLSQASAELASSLDYNTTLQNVARLAVRALADACFVDILGEDRSIRQVATAHQDTAKEDLLRELRRRYPIDPRGHHPVAKVLQTGVSQLTPEVSPEWLRSFAVDHGHLDLIVELGLRSDMIVPLVVHGQTLGAMSFLSSRPGRRYNLADLAVAKGLAHRAALAIDNARLYREAQEAVRLRNEFLGLVVHDLKNPLGAIKDYAQLVQFLVTDLDSPRAPKMGDLLERIDAIVMKMVTQINELLDVAHLQIGQPLLLEQSPVDLLAIAQQKAAEHQRERTRYRIAVDCELPALVGTWDGSRLERVLDNLLSNAIKYSPAGSDVIVRLAREESETGARAVLEVRDSGIGIPAADLPHIFERFHRGGNVVGAIAGSGLGLTGVRQIVLQHGGTIAVASQEGRGTTVTVRLPLAPA